MAHARPSIRRCLGAALVVLAALTLVPVAATAAQPAKVRLLATEPEYSRVTITAVDGRRVTAAPGLLRLNVNPIGAPQAERRGVCVDLHHAIEEGRDYEVSMTTASDDARLASPRHAEAGWLVQQADAIVGAVPSSARAREAGAVQVAVWQLVGEAREVAPTDDDALNARAAALRALAAGRAIGGPVTIAAEMSRACAGRGEVRLRLTGAPGSVATLSVTSGAGVVSPAEVRFDATGTASAAVSATAPGAVSVRARAEGGALTRLARARSGQTTPQETMVIVPSTHVATATVTFETCPLIPLEEDSGTPVVPTGPSGPLTPSAQPDGPAMPLETPTATPPADTPPAIPPAAARPPHHPTQSGPRLAIGKSGPSRIRAGGRARYLIRVANRGGVAANDVTVTDLLPDGMSLAAVPPGGRLRAGRVVWTIATLPAGATRTLRVSVRIDADIAGRRCNRATVTAAGVATRTARACTRVTALRRTLLPAVTS